MSIERHHRSPAAPRTQRAPSQAAHRHTAGPAIASLAHYTLLHMPAPSTVAIHGLRQATIRQLQRRYGNAAAQRLVDDLIQPAGPYLRRQPDTPGTAEDPTATWTRPQIRTIQRELRRLGFYQIPIDGIVGPVTRAGLVEAFGGDTWQALDPDTIIARLAAAERPQGRRGEHALRYGELFKDGVLDMTLGVGFDEGGAHQHTIEQFQQVLGERGFRDDRAAAAEIYRQAGRELGESAFGVFFVRRDALVYRPPAGEARPIHAVVRLVSSRDGTEGGAAASAFREGMTQSDVAYYSGHGRYGSGPDFDRNFMTFELLDAQGQIEQAIDDYDVLERVLRNEGRQHGRSAWQQFLWRVEQNRINVQGSNAGNVFINPRNMHSDEFGARLIYWSLKRSGATPATGRDGELAGAGAAHPERRYRLLVFDGCRTQDYVQSIRSTPGHDPRSTDILATQRTVDWGDEVRTLAAFLDSVLQQQSAEQIVRGMDREQGVAAGGPRGNAYRGFGLDDNPVIR